MIGIRDLATGAIAPRWGWAGVSVRTRAIARGGCVGIRLRARGGQRDRSLHLLPCRIHHPQCQGFAAWVGPQGIGAAAAGGNAARCGRQRHPQPWAARHLPAQLHRGGIPRTVQHRHILGGRVLAIEPKRDNLRGHQGFGSRLDRHQLRSRRIQGPTVGTLGNNRQLKLVLSRLLHPRGHFATGQRIRRSRAKGSQGRGHPLTKIQQNRRHHHFALARSPHDAHRLQAIGLADLPLQPGHLTGGVGVATGAKGQHLRRGGSHQPQGIGFGRGRDSGGIRGTRPRTGHQLKHIVPRLHGDRKLPTHQLPVGEGAKGTQGIGEAGLKVPGFGGDGMGAVEGAPP